MNKHFELFLSEMKFTFANSENLNSILGIVHEAQSYLASLNIDQWQDGYPQKEILEKDILNSESYLVCNEYNQILATAMFTTLPEPTYSNIEGKWKTDNPEQYGVIHRMAVSNAARGKGVAQFIFRECEQKLIDNNVDSMRIDTHEDNLGMQALLKKMGYEFCGIIYLANSDKRLAFEKLLLV